MYWSDLLPPSHTACPFYDPPLYFIPPLHILAGAQGGGVRVEIEFLRISHGGGFRPELWAFSGKYLEIHIGSGGTGSKWHLLIATVSNFETDLSR